MRSQATVVVRVFVLIDALVVALCFALAWPRPLPVALPELLTVLLVVPLWTGLFRFFGLYESHRIEGPTGLVRKLLSAQLLASCILAAPVLGLGGPQRAVSLGNFVALCTAVLLLERGLLYFLLRAFRRRGFDSRSVCVIGRWSDAEKMSERFRRHAEWGLRVTCVGTGRPQQRRYLAYPHGALLAQASLENLLRTQVVDELLIVVRPDELPEEKPTLSLCEQYGLMGRVLLDTSPVEPENGRVESFCGELTISVGQARRYGAAMAAKRVMDVLLALLAIVLLAPVMAVVALLVKLSSPGRVIFVQTRAGLNGRRFGMYKFRTMVDGAEHFLQSVLHNSVTGGPAFKDPQDCRVTPIGRILRRFSLDELPQLFNVLRGDMSFVGPRPLPVQEAQAVSGAHRRRFSMPPGITCLWQVNGRSNVEYTAWMNYDLEYVDGWSLWLDAKLLVRTIPAVLSGRGAY